MVPRPEGQGPTLETVHGLRQRVPLERLHEFDAVRALRLLDRLCDGIDGQVVPEGLVVGGTPPARPVAASPSSARSIVELVPPEDWKVAAEQFAYRPRVRRVDDAAGDLRRHPGLRVLLEEVGQVAAPEVEEDQV